MPDERTPNQPLPKSRRWQIALNVLVPLVLTLLSAFVALEVGFRIFYRLIPLEVCASDFIVANYYCQPYLVYDKPVRIAYRYRPGYKVEGWWDPEDVNNILERSVTVTLSEGDRGTLQWEAQYISFETFNQNHNAQERLFQDMADETGIEFLNLTPIFWQEAIARGELYNYIDLHWNQAGNDLAAEAIGAYMEGD